MQDDVRDPREGGKLPEQARLAVAALRDRGPAPDALRRLRSGLGVPDPAGPDGGSQPSSPEQAPEPTSPADPSPGSGPQAAGSSAAALPVVKALALVGVAVVAGGLWWSARDSAPTEVPSPTTPTESAVAAAPETPSSTQRLVAPAAASSSAPVPSLAASAEKASTKPGKAADQGPSEVELINRAQQLVRSRPEVALNLCRQHARRFPNGMLAQEREVLIVEALQRMGREDEARKKSRSFLEENPDTALRNKVEDLTGDAATEK